MTDLEIIKQIEEEFNITFKNEEFDFNTKNHYQKDSNNNVVELMMTEFEKSPLKWISKLEKLRVLDLSDGIINLPSSFADRFILKLPAFRIISGTV